MVSNLVTVVRGSCKRRDALQDAQFAKIKKRIKEWCIKKWARFESKDKS